MSRCAPCHDGTHQECAHTLATPCDCLVCIGERIGENVLSEHPHERDERDHWETVERDE